MRSVLKFIFTLCLLAFSFTSFAGNYVSVFKPKQKVKTLSEFKKNIQEDILQIRSIMSAEDKKKNIEKKHSIELVRNKKTNHKNPIEI